MNIQEEILNKLAEIEKEHDVTIFYACESGSRAWGFHSENSDYDVRFLYAHHRDWYLTIGQKKDVINLPVDEVLDIAGWDIRKALQLLKKSNAPLFEWLGSPIQYRCPENVVAPLRELSQKPFIPASSFHHYLSMSKKCFDTAKQGEQVKIKTYLYTIRTLLCARWILEKGTPPPMKVEELFPAFFSNQDEAVKEYLDQLIQQKKASTETAIIERSEPFEIYLKQQIATLEKELPKNVTKEPTESFDQVFRTILNGCEAENSSSNQ